VEDGDMTHTDGLAAGGDLRPGGWQGKTSVVTHSVEGRPGLKVGQVGQHTVYSDEAPAYGGQGEWPSPLSYAAMAIGW
jgi:hypothetical protein